MTNLVTILQFLAIQTPLCFLTSLLGFICWLLILPAVFCFLASTGTGGVAETRRPPTVAGPGGPAVPHSQGQKRENYNSINTFQARSCQGFRDNSGGHHWGGPHCLLELGFGLNETGAPGNCSEATGTALHDFLDETVTSDWTSD